MIDASGEERCEMIRILRNEEARAREKNPLERIIAIGANGPQSGASRQPRRSLRNDSDAPCATPVEATYAISGLITTSTCT